MNPMLKYQFNFQKTFHAAAMLLREHHGHMEPIRLLKLLYTTDRELLAECGRTLTGDQAVALRRGPVLTHVYDSRGTKARPPILPLGPSRFAATARSFFSKATSAPAG